MADKRVTIPSWVFDAASEETPPLVYNTTPPKSDRKIDPDAAGELIEELIALCEKHGLWVAGHYADLEISQDRSENSIRGAMIYD
jgi:hypothetical protein